MQQEQEVDLFEWCGLAAQSTTDTRNEVLSLKTKFSEQQEAIDKLNAQLEELIAAKSQHEVVLLEKFRLLLNEKKAKIRDQQRLLATAKVDPEKLEPRLPMRLCDDAARTISTHYPELRFTLAGQYQDVDRQIKLMQEEIARWKR